ncbi:hypothetical protein GCM10007426_41570 [Alloalcanivorax dieselolei]|uniref:hypothetical protein n=1 Tax=Alloalcanivorax dieselolei TaxID=285091 RepID=UPI0011D24673|nr:hypothetical protein [Alloalcanivorax dieselolei]GGK09052.1 hypothetical protein GCM10007426_41570 [Alloalcanivorax dieselolei]
MDFRFLGGALISGQALSLSNENFKVSQVDVTKDLGIVWIDASSKEITNRPVCDPKNYNAVACEISDDFCKAMISIALTAKSTSNVVDFEYDGQCKDVFATGSRFRLSN